ncbi:MAG TPA: metallophosphoesterase, partial [Armatimonadota bacterium]|nr:metallophosphoesterase [Armatimonadota bacterium]
QAKPGPLWLWLLHIAADSTLFGLALATLAILAGSLAPYPFFSIVRLACQGLFGEGLLLLAGITVVQALSPARRRAAVTGLLAAGVLLAYSEAYHRCPYDLQVRRYFVDLSKGRPRGSFKLVHLSDIQCDRVGEHEERALRLARDLQPDLLVFTGDYVQPRLGTDRGKASREFNALLRRIGLRPRLGAFAVRGDTERDGWRTLFAGTAVTCLEDRQALVRLPSGVILSLTGLSLESSRARSRADLAAVLPEGPGEALRLVLGHAPDGVRALKSGQKCDLYLAGHTHGGQVVLPFFGPPVTLSRLPRRYAAGGLHRFDGTWLHVSRGIGMERRTAPQVRFMCPPEVCVLDVRY